MNGCPKALLPLKLQINLSTKDREKDREIFLRGYASM